MTVYLREVILLTMRKSWELNSGHKTWQPHLYPFMYLHSAGDSLTELSPSVYILFLWGTLRNTFTAEASDPRTGEG